MSDIPQHLITSIQRSRYRTRNRQTGRFLKGPIPWSWLVRAASLPGRALHVGIVLWYLAGVTKRGTVKCSAKVVGELGVDRHAMYRGLRQLEAAGLVALTRRRGRAAMVTVQKVLPPGLDGTKSQPSTDHG